MFEVTLPFPEESVRLPVHVPVFPLEGAILLPGEPMPLHIFEERYKMMTEAALMDGRFLALAAIQPGQTRPTGILGLGKIVMEEKFVDGRFNIILLGLKRIRVKSFLQERPYLRAEIEILEDTFSQTSVTVINSLSKEVYDLGKQLLSSKKKGPNDVSYPDLENLPFDLLPLGILCDLFSAALAFPSLEKQMLLEEEDAIRRAEKLIFTMRFELEKRHSGPGFSSVLQ